MDHKLEAVVVPVSDLDRLRYFYRALGFRLDLDQADTNGQRLVQLTPPGSSCSIVLCATTPAAAGSSTGVLTVTDLPAAVADLQALGAAPSIISTCQHGYRHASLPDPDGNQWLLVESHPSHRCNPQP